MAELEIECTLRPHEKYEYVFGPRGEKTKLGSYHGSYFWEVEGFGREKWVISLVLEGVGIDTSLHQGLSVEEVVEGCIRYLNKPIGKRKKKKLYGSLETLSRLVTPGEEEKGRMRCTVQEKKGTKYISLLAVTDDRRNKNFWGKGQKVPAGLRAKR
jgi:hypothetical protein|tara:strand:+ start:652 stop:1119 length:468 start_codon:yes stop_codon:yes gene_type:complete